MLDKLKDFLKRLNTEGIYLPMIKDPKNGPSVSLTLVVISSLFVEASLIGKLTKALEGIDIQQSLNFFLISCGLYFGRNLTTKDITSTKEGNDEKS